MPTGVFPVIGVVLFVHLAVTVVGRSISKRIFIFFGGHSFGKHAHQVGVIIFIVALLMLFAGNVVFEALPHHIRTNETLGFVYYGSLFFAVLVLVLLQGMATELVTRYKEMGFSGFSLRLLASFMTSVVIAYVFFQLGLTGQITEVQVASLFGVSLALSLQVG